ncbi:MAG: type II secretion system protein GspG [Bdellovibrionales bacterium]|nr:type II secretion system protein GspG [Bdellovibrionales bacterium]
MKKDTKKPTRSLRSEAGLTIVEIIVVLIILALVTTFLGQRLFGAGDKAKVNITKLQMKEIGSAIEQFRLQYNSLPGGLNDLTSCTDATGPGCVPILQEEQIKDAWGNLFAYSLEGSGRAYRITSLGANGQQGGEGVDFDLFQVGP